MNHKETRDAIFLAIQEAHKIIGTYTSHTQMASVMNKKCKVLDRLAIKYRLNPSHLHKVYFGKL